MRHHLQVVGHGEDAKARCACGGWEKQDPDWAFGVIWDGYMIRRAAWDEYEAHVRQHDPNVVRCYQLSGWYPAIPPQDRRQTNISDGGIFSTPEKVEEFVRARRIHVSRVEMLLLPADDPQIDFFLCDVAEQDRRLGIG